MLHLLCVTLGEAYTERICNEQRRMAELIGASYTLVWDMRLAANKSVSTAPIFLGRTRTVHSEGYLESVLDQALGCIPPDPGPAHEDYILRLDDDELPSPGLLVWLHCQQYLRTPIWKFDRRHWWGEVGTYIISPPLFPDHQTRLSLRPLAGGRGVIHAGSPFGGGELAPPRCYIGHHKFLVKSREEREAVAARYDSISPGAGTHPAMAPFQTPEVLSQLSVRTLDWTDEGL